MKILVIVKLRSTSDVARIGKAANSINQILDRFGEKQTAFTSHDYKTFGILLLSDKPLAAIRAALDGSPEITNDDAAIVVEVGSADATQGMSAALTWIQRH